MAKCVCCGRAIKNVYTWNGKTYGKECWKREALPELEAQKQRNWDKVNQERTLEARALVEVLKAKDLSKITNGFKLRVIPQMIEQFEEKGFLSVKQMEMVEEWFTQKDSQLHITLLHEFGLMDEFSYLLAMVGCTRGKVQKEHFTQLVEVRDRDFPHVDLSSLLGMELEAKLSK